MKKCRRPKDINQLVKLIADIAVGVDDLPKDMTYHADTTQIKIIRVLLLS